VRIGYIDTEYILENIPDYQNATSQLEQKVQKWKIEIEAKLKVIEQKKKQLENESVLLTRELYDERFEEISFEESEILDYQQKRFGPNGDLVIQKKQLVQPIQDQIYAAVQEIADKRNYDFIFDKNSDFLMLYSAERYDISEIVLRSITRASRQANATTSDQRRALREEEALDNRTFEEVEREEKEAKQEARNDSILLDRRAQREADLAERKRLQEEAREARRKETEARRQKALDQRNGVSANKQVTDTTGVKSSLSTEPPTADSSKSTDEKAKTAAEIQEERRQLKLKEREERRKELEERKKKILEQRQKAREEREARAKRADSIAKAKNGEPKKTEENKEQEENK
jgi:Skp family chaperone for outer membrane proteins